MRKFISGLFVFGFVFSINLNAMQEGSDEGISSDEEEEELIQNKEIKETTIGCCQMIKDFFKKLKTIRIRVIKKDVDEKKESKLTKVKNCCKGCKEFTCKGYKFIFSKKGSFVISVTTLTGYLFLVNIGAIADSLYLNHYLLEWVGGHLVTWITLAFGNIDAGMPEDFNLDNDTYFLKEEL